MQKQIRKLKQSTENGITLVALVVTIIVLLILAGVSISLVLGNNGVITKASTAVTENRKATAQEDIAMAWASCETDYLNEWTKNTSLSKESYLSAEEITNKFNNQYLTGGQASNISREEDGSITGTYTSNDKNTNVDFIIESNGVVTIEETGPTAIDEGLKVGDTVTYSPSGEYKWKADYCSASTQNQSDQILKNSDTNYQVTEWKVFSIDEKTKKVELISTNPTEGTVYLGQAQGYNNGVKLLNEACNSLYGNTNKSITGRSINIEDIEGRMTEEALNGENGAHKCTSNGTQYGKQVGTPHTSNKYYPLIYELEDKSVINGQEKSRGLELSDSTKLLNRTDSSTLTTNEVQSTTATDGYVQATTSIQPYQTYWTKDNAFMKTAFKPYSEESSDENCTNYKLIIPNGTSTTYWVASRCVSAFSNHCSFCMLHVKSGYVGASNMFGSDGTGYDSNRALRPVVSLSAKLIQGNAETGWSIENE